MTTQNRMQQIDTLANYPMGTKPDPFRLIKKTFKSGEPMKRKLTLLLTCLLAGISLAIAQTSRKVMGVVFSEEDNQPVIGASVLVKGTSIGTTTDLDGKFVINNVPSSSRTW